MRIDYKKLNKEMRMEKTSRIVSFFRKNEAKFKLEEYKILNNEERLDFIATTIEEIYPGYRVDYRKICYNI